MTKRCHYCGQFFVPDVRAVKTQKACARAKCRKARKKEAHKKWCEDNPESFKNHYRDYVVPYRQRKRVKLPSSSEVKAVDKIKDRMPEMIKDEIPAKVIKDGIPPSKPMVELVLLIPGDAVGMIKNEIRLRKVDTNMFAAYG